MKVTKEKLVIDWLLIILGMFSASLGLKGFLLSSHFIDGGVTGISILLANVTEIPLAILILVLNIPFLILGYKRLGLNFAIKSLIGITGLSLCLAFIHFPDITPDKLLTAVFGGFFIGVGIGFAMRGGAVLDGTEIAALLLSKKAQLLKVSDVVLIFNVLIFGAAAFLISIESALYSILTYITATKTMDLILNGIEQYTGITVISLKSEVIRKVITMQLGRGVTIYNGKSGYGKDGQVNEARDIIFTVVTRLEVPALKERVLKVDPAAFIIQHSIDDTTGGLMKRKALH